MYLLKMAQLAELSLLLFNLKWTKGGNLSDIKPLTNFGYGMEQEAIRVIKKSGKWIPAIQNGSEVTATANNR